MKIVNGNNTQVVVNVQITPMPTRHEALSLETEAQIVLQALAIAFGGYSYVPTSAIAQACVGRASRWTLADGKCDADKATTFLERTARLIELVTVERNEYFGIHECEDEINKALKDMDIYLQKCGY